MGCRFEQMQAYIDEKAIRDEDPERLTLLLARAKADALLPLIANQAILITSDQVVLCKGRMLEKPEGPDEARRFLIDYGSSPARTVTAVVVTDTAARKRVEGVDVAEVVFRPIPPDVIERIIASGEVLHRAGGFSIEDPLFKDYIVRIEGEAESVMGLPMEMTRRLIGEACSVQP